MNGGMGTCAQKKAKQGKQSMTCIHEYVLCESVCVHMYYWIHEQRLCKKIEFTESEGVSAKKEEKQTWSFLNMLYMIAVYLCYRTGIRKVHTYTLTHANTYTYSCLDKKSNGNKVFFVVSLERGKTTCCRVVCINMCTQAYDLGKQWGKFRSI